MSNVNSTQLLAANAQQAIDLLMVAQSMKDAPAFQRATSAESNFQPFNKSGGGLRQAAATFHDHEAKTLIYQ